MTKLDKINSDKEYDEAVIFMNSLLDTIGEDEAHSLAATLEKKVILCQITSNCIINSRHN